MSATQLHIKYASKNIVFNEEFKNIVRLNRLLDFNHVMSLNNGEVIKHAVPERKTVRLSLNSANGVFKAYLKRHYPMPLSGTVLQLLKLTLPKTAFDEFRNITEFHRAGIPTMLPVAAGITGCGFLKTESFLISKALEGCTRLDNYLSEHSQLSADVKIKIIKAAALMVKKMHACGFNHRDLYLCHLLIDASAEVFIVDLHRVDIRKQVPVRWKVKDIAALNYSAPQGIVSRTDRLRFLKIYLGTDRLTATEKCFALKVLKKTEKMLKHNRKRDQAQRDKGTQPQKRMY